LFWLVVLDMKPDQEWSRFKFLDCMMNAVCCAAYFIPA